MLNCVSSKHHCTRATWKTIFNLSPVPRRHSYIQSVNRGVLCTAPPSGCGRQDGGCWVKSSEMTSQHITGFPSWFPEGLWLSPLSVWHLKVPHYSHIQLCIFSTAARRHWLSDKTSLDAQKAAHLAFCLQPLAKPDALLDLPHIWKELNTRQ